MGSDRLCNPRVCQTHSLVLLICGTWYDFEVSWSMGFRSISFSLPSTSWSRALGLGDGAACRLCWLLEMMKLDVWPEQRLSQAPCWLSRGCVVCSQEACLNLVFTLLVLAVLINAFFHSVEIAKGWYPNSYPFVFISQLEYFYKELLPLYFIWLPRGIVHMKNDRWMFVFFLFIYPVFKIINCFPVILSSEVKN